MATARNGATTPVNSRVRVVSSTADGGQGNLGKPSWAKRGTKSRRGKNLVAGRSQHVAIGVARIVGPNPRVQLQPDEPYPVPSPDWVPGSSYQPPTPSSGNYESPLDGDDSPPVSESPLASDPPPVGEESSSGSEGPPTNEPPPGNDETPPTPTPTPEPAPEPAEDIPLFSASRPKDFWLLQAAPGAITEAPDPAGSGETVLRFTVNNQDVYPATPTEDPRAKP